MGDAFDPYREALVIEEITIWPDELDTLEPGEKERFEKLLHASPEEAAELSYVRMHTGFTRRITVTPEDLERLQSAAC